MTHCSFAEEKGIEHDCVGELKEWKNYAAMDDKYKAALRWLLFEDNEGKTRDIKLFKRLEELLKQGKLMKCAQIDQKIRSRANIGSRKDNKKRQKQKMKNTVNMQELAKSFGNISIDDNPRARPSARNSSKSVFDEEFLKPMFALRACDKQNTVKESERSIGIRRIFGLGRDIRVYG